MHLAAQFEEGMSKDSSFQPHLFPTKYERLARGFQILGCQFALDF